MFHFPAFPPRALYIQARVTPHDWCGVSPFGDPRITVRLPTPRGISQATTSFFGSWCQGIHPVPLQTSTTENKDARVHCAVLKQRPGPPRAPTTTTAHRARTTPARPTADVEDPRPRSSPHHPQPTPTEQTKDDESRSDETPTTGGCSLRTQQCVLHPPRPTRPEVPTPHQGARRTDQSGGSRHAVVDVPPMSTTPHTNGGGMAPGHARRTHAAGCSLERR